MHRRRKHGAIDIPLGPASFQLSEPDSLVVVPIGGPWVFAGSTLPHTLVASVRLPRATMLHTVSWIYNRGGAGTITARVGKGNLLGGGTATILNTQTFNAGTGLTTTATPDLNYSVEPGYELYVSVQVTNGANQFVGAILAIDRP